jgi:hypothetical protein
MGPPFRFKNKKINQIKPKTKETLAKEKSNK